MIASWRGLAIAAVIAVGLVIAVIIDVARARAPVDRALVPGFDPDRVTELVWERAGQPAVRVVRAGGAWQIPASAPADPRAVGDVLAALRGARWHRAAGPVATAATLTVVSGTARDPIGIGAPIAGTEQRWLVVGDRGLVVDGWVARALDPAPLALRIRTPLSDVRAAKAIVVEGELPGDGRGIALRIEGRPRRLVRPAELLLAADLASELERALGELAITRLPAAPVAAHGLAISAAGAGGAAAVVTTVEIGGSCPGAPALVAVAGTAGDGCVEHAAIEAIVRAVGRLTQPPEAIVERRPVPFELRRAVLTDGAVLATSPPKIDDHAADEARVAELLAALAAPAEAVPRPPWPTTSHLEVTGRAGEAITLDVFPGRIIARRGESIALHVAPGAWDLLRRPSRALRDLGLWLEEPTTITSLAIDGVRYQRGATIGAWTREPAGAVDAAAVEALVTALATPRASGFVDDTVPVVHHMTLSITPPVGAPSQRTLEIGAPRRVGCPVRIGGESFLLPVSVCHQVAALARKI